MTRLLLATVAFAAFATLASAQEPSRQPPNPDTDHDGKVTLAEFKAMESGRQTRMFTRMDINKDGKITQAEMEAARKRMEAEGRGPPAGAGPGGGGGPRGGGGGFLTRFDTNHDGWLSKGELLMMRQRMRGPGSSE